MLKWCAYCQEFQGEVPPFDDFSHTHGICRNCKLARSHANSRQIEHAQALRAIQDRLMVAGRSNDPHMAASIVAAALDVRMRPIDILLGLVSPTLYCIGNEWEDGTVSVADEHRHTAFCELVFELVRDMIATDKSDHPIVEPADIILMNAPGNTHTLGIRFLELWLTSNGSGSLVLDPPPAIEELARVVQTTQPKFLLISVALPEQMAAVSQIVELLSRGAVGTKPQIIVGGYAVKFGLVQPIAGIALASDINQLTGLIAAETLPALNRVPQT